MSNAVFDEVRDWVEDRPFRSVTCKFSNGCWFVAFTGQTMDLVRVASSRDEIPEDALIACLEAGLKQVKS